MVWICHVSVRFDSNTPREPPHTLLTAFLRSAQCAGVEERASARESAADIALNFAAGAISRPAMAGTARGTDLETVDPEVESGRVRILERCSATFVRRDLCESGAKKSPLEGLTVPP